MRITPPKVSSNILLVSCVFISSICIIAGFAQAYQILPTGNKLSIVDETLPTEPFLVSPTENKAVQDHEETKGIDNRATGSGSVSSTSITVVTKTDNSPSVIVNNGNRPISLPSNSCKPMPNPSNSCKPIPWPSNSCQPVRIITTSTYDPFNNQYDIMARYIDNSNDTSQITITLHKIIGIDWSYIEKYSVNYDRSGNGLTQHFTVKSSTNDSYLVVIHRTMTNGTTMEYYCSMPYSK